MRYTQPFKKVVFTGSRALFSTALRQYIQPKKAPAPKNNEYPVFFMHGFMGFSEMKILNIRLFDYFNGVKTLLEQMGYTVYTDSVKPIDPPQDRAGEWARHVDNALRETGAKKLHIIAHSQGCIDARVLAAPQATCCNTPHHGKLNGMGYGDKIASLTSIGGPHLGTPLADDGKESELEKMMLGIIDLIAIMTGSTPKKARQAIDSMSRDYMMKVFNHAIVVPNTIPCYTVAGNPQHKDNVSLMLDSSWEALMKIAVSDGGGDNDGFVPVTSAQFAGNNTKLKGTSTPQWQPLGEITADHVAMIGLPMDLKDNENFSHLPMYVGLAQNVDACYRRNILMALQADGEWQRTCALIP